MATYGKVTVPVTGFDDLVFEWTLASQSIENNSSVVTWTMKLVAGASGAIESSVKKAWEVWVNGNKYTGSGTTGIGNNQTKTLASGSTTIPHNDDGSKTFSFSFKQVFKGLVFAGVSVTDKSGSGNGVLPTIARASQPSLITWPEHTQNVGNFGTEISIHMNRKSDAFTHTVRYAYGSLTGTIATGVATGTTWEIPLSFMDLIPNATSGSGTIYVDTYNGNTFVGTKYCGFTATVPASVKPTCTFTLEDITGVDDIYGSPVKSLSRIKVVVTAKQAYKSPIVAYTISANGATYNAAEATTDFLKTAGPSRITVTVMDERGRTGSNSYDMSVQDYTAPTVTRLTVQRCDADGNEDDQGEYVKTTFSAAVTSLSSKNTSAYSLRYKKSSDSSWTSHPLSVLDGLYTLTDRWVVFAADGNNSYDVEFTATDRHGAATRSTSVSTAFTLMNWGADGTSMGIGMVAEKPGTLGIALKTEHLGEVITQGNSYCTSGTGKEATAGFVLMAQITILGAYVNSPITFVFTQRGALTPMQVNLSFNSVATVTPTIKAISYEGSNYDAYAVQLDDSVWGIYVKKSEAYDIITLQEWFTSERMNDRIEVTFPGTHVSTVPTPYYKATPAQLQSLLDYIYPVGSIYLSYSHVNPGTLFGGTWVRIQNAFLWAVDPDGTIGQTGGSKTHTLTVDELPSHSHGSVYSQHAAGTKSQAWYSAAGSSLAYGVVATGGGAAHNNMPPYIQVSAWHRTA